MKKLLFILGFGLIVGMVNLNKVEAQVYVNINIDIHPAWGPSGYDYAEYYYIPEINIYYDVINRLYIYPNRGRWISSMYLPLAYSYYDFYSLYKVVLNGIFRPWRLNRSHINLYSGYCYNYFQVPIYYMREPHYHLARHNYYVWVEPRHMPHNNGRPLYRDYSMNQRNGRISNEMRSSNTPARRETTGARSDNTARNTNNRSATTSRSTNSTVNTAPTRSANSSSATPSRNANSTVNAAPTRSANSSSATPSRKNET